MKRTQLRKPLLVAALTAVTLLAGCVVRGSVEVPAPAVYVGTVSVAPPPPQVEVIGVPPQPGYLWIGGYWNWVGGGMFGSGAIGQSRAPGIAGFQTNGSAPAGVGSCEKDTGLAVDRWISKNERGVHS